MKYTQFSDMVGQVFDSVKVFHHNELNFKNTDGTHTFEHKQSCCEDVYIEDICGDLNDLIGTPILEAEKRTQDDDNAKSGKDGMWTFYEFRTIKGSVTIRWYGTSNGYYSIGVDYQWLPSREYIEADKISNPDNYDYRRYQKVR